ncbi:MAG: hypothetical protein NVS3B19_09030 [Ginsengibacter sp.]
MNWQRSPRFAREWGVWVGVIETDKDRYASLAKGEFGVGVTEIGRDRHASLANGVFGVGVIETDRDRHASLANGFRDCWGIAGLGIELLKIL